MKSSLLVVLSLTLYSLKSSGQSVCLEARKLIKEIHSHHIQPRKINDALSSAIFNQFFKRIDPNQQLFIASDTALLSTFKTQLTSDGSQTCGFIDASITLYRTKATQFVKFVDSLLSKPLDYSKFDSISVAYSYRVFGTTKDQRDYTVRDLKYEILKSIYRQASRNTDSLLNVGKFTSLEPAARKRVHKNTLMDIHSLLSDDKKLRLFIESSFLEAIPKAFDPNSNYFEKRGFEEFLEGMSSSKFSFGLKFKMSLIGEVVVDQVIPEGPAWLSGKIETNDAIIGIKWRSSEEYIDLIDVDLEKVNLVLSDRRGFAADLTVKKPNGDIVIVTLLKAALSNEDNMILSYVLTSNDKKIGYISLPGFFINNDEEFEGCAAAVRDELVKLKAEKIDGLILDLRFNGGGSLKEAVQLTGLFIEKGPVAIVEKTSKTVYGTTVVNEVLLDPDNDIAYDGPMIIMINAASGSASELVSGTLQDYKRAVVVGTPSYGKGTGQIFVPLGDEEILSVTDMRFYRVGGKPHQREGIMPDYVIPDLSAQMYFREKNQDRALSPMPSPRMIKFKRWPHSFGKIEEYKTQNVLSEKFSFIEKMRVIMKGNIPLKTEHFIKMMNEFWQIDRNLYPRNGSLQNDLYSVNNTEPDRKLFLEDLYHGEMNKIHAGEIAESIHIAEAFKLMAYMVSDKK